MNSAKTHAIDGIAARRATYFLAALHLLGAYGCASDTTPNNPPDVANGGTGGVSVAGAAGTAGNGGIPPSNGGSVASNTGGKGGTSTGGMNASGGGTNAAGAGAAAGNGGGPSAGSGGSAGGSGGSGGANTLGGSSSGDGGSAAGGTSSTGGANAGGTGASGGAGGPGGNANTGGMSNTGGAGGSNSAGSAGQTTGGSGGKGGAPGVAKIMAIGDSITRATCWRALLWQQLQQNFAGRFDLVGTLKADSGCGVSGFDSDNQGYSSSLITEAVAGVTNARTCDPSCPSLSALTTAFNAARPTIVLMHWGTNDVWNGKSTSSITSAYSAVIDALRAANPSVTVLLAQIVPMNVTSATCAGCSCASCSSGVTGLNTAITAFAAMKSTAASPVVVVDQYSGFNASSDTRDGVHPNNSGSQKMATRWYQALTTNQLVR